MQYRAECAHCGKVMDARKTPKRQEVVLHRHLCGGLHRWGNTYMTRGAYKPGTLVAKAGMVAK